MTRILAIDHGTRRIGLAVGDTESGFAFPRPALQRRGGKRDLDTLRELARAEQVDEVIVGLPLNMDGSEGPQAAAARAFGERLVAIGFRVIYADERLSSWQAREQLRATGEAIDRRSGELDSAAARLLLQEYLDAHRSPSPDPEDPS